LGALPFRDPLVRRLLPAQAHPALRALAPREQHHLSEARPTHPVPYRAERLPVGLRPLVALPAGPHRAGPHRAGSRRVAPFPVVAALLVAPFQVQALQLVRQVG
jgi:hypothetical protein